MTCVISIIDKSNGSIIMGADSVAGGDYIFKNPKVFKKNNFIIGFTTSWRMGQLLQYVFNIPDFAYINDDPLRYMVVDFIPALMECFKNNSFTEEINKVERGGTFLIGFYGNLFVVNSNYQVEQWDKDYVACGCGTDIALGSLYYSSHLLPYDRIKLALEASAEFSNGVRGPFIIETLN